MVAAGLFGAPTEAAAAPEEGEEPGQLPGVAGAQPAKPAPSAKSSAPGLSRRPARQLGGHDPLHAQKLLGFARFMLVGAHTVLTPLGDPVQMRIGECSA